MSSEIVSHPLCARKTFAFCVSYFVTRAASWVAREEAAEHIEARALRHGVARLSREHMTQGNASERAWAVMVRTRRRHGAPSMRFAVMRRAEPLDPQRIVVALVMMGMHTVCRAADRARTTDQLATADRARDYFPCASMRDGFPMTQRA